MHAFTFYGRGINTTYDSCLDSNLPCRDLEASINMFPFPWSEGEEDAVQYLNIWFFTECMNG